MTFELGRRGLAAGALLLAWLVVATPAYAAPVGASGAAASLVVVASSPSANARVDTAPRTVSVRFNEPVEAPALHVYGPSGERVDLDGTTTLGNGGLSAGVTIQGAGAGGYLLTWAAESLRGGPQQGSLVFAIGRVPGWTSGPGGGLLAAGGSSGSLAAALEGADGIALVAMVVLAGAIVVLALRWLPSDYRGRRWVTALIAVAGAGTAVALFLHGPFSAGLPAGQALSRSMARATLHSAWGVGALVALIGLAIIAAVAPFPTATSAPTPAPAPDPGRPVRVPASGRSATPSSNGPRRLRASVSDLVTASDAVAVLPTTLLALDSLASPGTATTADPRQASGAATAPKTAIAQDLAPLPKPTPAPETAATPDPTAPPETTAPPDPAATPDPTATPETAAGPDPEPDSAGASQTAPTRESRLVPEAHAPSEPAKKQRRARRRSTTLALAGVVLLVVAAVAEGHGPSEGLAATWVALTAIHVVAAVALVALLLVRFTPSQSPPGWTAGVTLARLKGIALVVVATGVALAAHETGSFSALTDTGYGHIVIAAAVLGVGAFLTLYGAGGPTSGSGRLTLPLVAVSALITGALIFQTPGRDTAPRPATGSVTATGLDVEYQLTPARIGANGMHIYVFDANGEPLAVPNAVADLRWSGASTYPLPVALSQAGPGHFLDYGVEVPFAGSWTLDLEIDRGGGVPPTTLSQTITIHR